MNNKSGSTIAAFLAGAAAALVAGGYFLYGPEGRRHRKQVEGFLEDTKDEILERMQDAKHLTQDAYNDIVDEVLEDSHIAKRYGRAQAQKLSQKFKRQWRGMKEEAQAAADEAELELEEE
jgi:hypothetical protein